MAHLSDDYLMLYCLPVAQLLSMQGYIRQRERERREGEKERETELYYQRIEG